MHLAKTKITIISVIEEFSSAKCKTKNRAESPGVDAGIRKIPAEGDQGEGGGGECGL